METLPFEQMFPANHVVRKGRAFCLSRPGDVYALYLPAGGPVELELTPGNRYEVEWFDPRRGEWRSGPAVAGGVRNIAAPDGRDWAVRIRKRQGNAVAPPTAASAKISSKRGQSVPIRLAVLGDTPYEYEIVTPPRHGKLEGSGGDRVFRPTPGFTGQDQFEWRVRGKDWVSNTATVVVTANASGVNTPPRAEDLTVTVRSGQPKTFILPYSDADGPGPYRIVISKRPSKGTIEGIDNDITYTPASGFRGADEIEWLVRDGEARSNVAKVRILVE